MALETGTYISDLVVANPTLSDPVSQGDDHLRLLKSTIKTTFPNVAGAVTATHSEINRVISIKPGLIVCWSTLTLPTGWKLCNGEGTISDGTPVPNLLLNRIGTTYWIIKD